MKMFFQVRQTNMRTSAARSDPNSDHNGQKATVHWTQDKSTFFILTIIGARILSINRTYLFHHENSARRVRKTLDPRLKPLAWQLRLHGPQALIKQDGQA